MGNCEVVCFGQRSEFFEDLRMESRVIYCYLAICQKIFLGLTTLETLLLGYGLIEGIKKCPGASTRAFKLSHGRKVTFLWFSHILNNRSCGRSGNLPGKPNLLPHRTQNILLWWLLFRPE